jgi:cation transport regulator ChaC
MSRRVWVFFYGSYMSPDVLAEVGLRPPSFEVARLDGCDIVIAPRANLVPEGGAAVYGVLAEATHDELRRLYAHAQDVLGEVYLPEAVLVQTADLKWRTALCYIAPEMESRPPERAYVERIVAAAKRFAFPRWYLDRLARFVQ